MIRMAHVSKSYATKTGRFTAVDDISFDIPKGRVVGLIGPNGAGKSTTVKMLVGILAPDAGEICVAGYTPHAQRRKLALHLGVMFGNRSSLLSQLKARESLLLMKDMYAIPKDIYDERVEMYAQLLEVAHLLDKRVLEMSLGQRIRVELLVTLLHDPDVLIFDEPTLGLDLLARQAFRGILRNLVGARGKTVLVTSHDLADIEKICDEILLINHGKLLVHLDRVAFMQKVAEIRVVSLPAGFSVPEVFSDFVREADDLTTKLVVPCTKLDALIERLREGGAASEFSVEAPGLEDIVYENYAH